MKRYMIERDIPGVGAMEAANLSATAAAANRASAPRSPRVQWHHSYIAGGKSYCVYLAENEEVIRAHAALSGFPATTITEITGVIDPTTANLV